MFPLASAEVSDTTDLLLNSSLNFSYGNDYEDEICEKDDVVKFGSLVTPVFFSVVIALSVTGNILVLVILALYESLKSLTNIFILNLAISDLVFTVGLPFWVYYHVRGWLLPEILCKIVNFVFYTGFYSSILCLTSMTIYRYMVVVCPLTDRCRPKLSTGIFLSFLMWTISIAGAMPSLLQTSITEIHLTDGHSAGCEYSSEWWKNASTYQQNLFFVFAFAVMAFCYIQILQKIRRTRSRTKSRAVRLVFCIVTVFFVGWVPYNVVIFLRVLVPTLPKISEDCDQSKELDYAFYVCRLVAFSHCCLNPVLYVFVGVKFRSHLKSILQKGFKRESPVEEQQVKTQNFISQGSMY
ncbi:chemokine (C motif) receptor 1a, duplicate 1 [Oryzias melastigma]|uniref:Chemokine (C motif) receptor 1a, duplicate 1 n=1 Tax=Oryzias melastigma TaxID=30732 RepID=A0A3B3D6B7_ORYME|nr:chemokine (C motif) receptor 1a, duplicate 1 [Oryzias melastigma]